MYTTSVATLRVCARWHKDTRNAQELLSLLPSPSSPSSCLLHAARACVCVCVCVCACPPARSRAADKIASNKVQQSAMSTSAAPTAGALEYASTCVIPTEWLDLPLIRRTEVTANTRQFTFGTPAGKPLALPTCACLLVKGVDSEGEDAVRPYTPVSQAVAGEFDLLVKVYEQGKCSKYLDGLSIGDKVAMKHIKFNIKIQYPFNKKSLTMICGGTGITPMYQALDLLMNTPGDDTKVTVLYVVPVAGRRVPADHLPACVCACVHARACVCVCVCVCVWWLVVGGGGTRMTRRHSPPTHSAGRHRNAKRVC